MLESFRNAAQSTIAKIILALVTLPFVFFGVDSYFQSSAAQDTIAKVGRQHILTAEFTQALQAQLDQFRQQFGGSIDPKLLDTPEIRKSILDRLISSRVITESAKNNYIVISDATLREK